MRATPRCRRSRSSGTPARWVGVDLSATTDITAVVALVEDSENPEIYDVVPFFFVPEERIVERSRRDRVPYVLWRDQGYIVATEGNIVDYDVVRQQVRELGEVLDVVEIPIDRWNSTGLQTQLTGDGFVVAQFGQGFASMSAPTKELERMLLSKRLRHGGNPVLRWMASNVAVVQDAAGNMKPAKDKSTRTHRRHRRADHGHRARRERSTCGGTGISDVLRLIRRR